MAHRFDLRTFEDRRSAIIAFECDEEGGNLRISPELPLITSLGVIGNIALFRALRGAIYFRSAEPVAWSMLERLDRRDLGSRSIATLLPDEVFLVKCLAALASPNGHFSLLCGGHIADTHEEAALFGMVLTTFPERMMHVMLYADPHDTRHYAQISHE